MMVVFNMMSVKKMVLFFIVAIALLGGCMFIRSKKHKDVDIVRRGASSVVPNEDTLVDKLTNRGYTIDRYDYIYSLDVQGERVYAQKGDKFIDICYYLEKEDVETVFSFFESKYKNTDFYILAQNENYVYCISDKQTFKLSGFTSTDNIGIQYIHE